MKHSQIAKGNIIQKCGESKFWKIDKILSNSDVLLRELDTMIPKTVDTKRLEEDYEQWI